MGIRIAKSRSLCFSLFCFLVLVCCHPCGGKVTKLVQEVCAKTSNYSFCVESLYSDPHAAEADAYWLADIAFRLAYVNATSTQNHILELLKKSTSGDYRGRLQRCGSDYKKAVSAIEMGLNDLNSESFDLLAGYADHAAHAASDCQSAFEGSPNSPLTYMNNAFKGLCEICVVISKLFTDPNSFDFSLL
ncbi:hypothetical protein L6164_036080 [Bauhinia variegata]|uniref:Uncharacterized protein n=1 Tax=Bauhinia variegata TaxID=167791 RepID=A0ACB9KFW9_BAUVA|nr:hypothetical protein L6164_036080 [Bauhinia variegata]